MKLWNKQDVLDAMETEEFNLELEKVNKRKTSSKKAQNTRVDNLKKKMKQIADGITVSILPQKELEEKTLKHQEFLIYERISREAEYLERHCNSSEDFDEYERRVEETENFKMHRPNDEATMQRWTVNYIRHNLIAYDRNLYTLRGKTGKDEAYIIFKSAVLEKIAEAYPTYAEECQRQIDELAYLPRQSYRF